MSLTVTQVQNIFKVLGKGIFLSNLVMTHALAYESLMMGLAAQANAGTSSAFDGFQSVVVPANTAIKGIITKVSGGTAAAQTINENYLTNVVAPMLGMDITAVVTDILDALRSQIVTNGQYITTAGLFDTYIRAAWSYTSIPTSGSSSIPDSYVTDAVV